MAGPCILVVEDHEETRVTFGAMLELMGAEVLLAATVDEALAEVARDAPDIILSDLGLADTDGHELARRLREHPRRKSMRLIAVTGFCSADDRARAMAAGFDGLLPKPVVPEAIEAFIQNFASG